MIIVSEDGKKQGELIDKALAIRDKKQDSALKGNLKGDLKRVPDKACCLIVGNFSDDMKQGMDFIFGAAPDAILAHMTRTQNGLDLELRVELADAKDALMFVKKVGSIRDEALGGLKNIPPIPDFPVGQIQNLLQSIQIQAQGAGADLRVLVPEDLLRSLPRAMLGFRAAEFPPPMEKEK